MTCQEDESPSNNFTKSLPSFLASRANLLESLPKFRVSRFPKIFVGQDIDVLAFMDQEPVESFSPDFKIYMKIRMGKF